VALIIIPEHFEELPRDLAPICIEDRDPAGKLINPQWIDRGVRPIHRPLCRLTARVLGDVGLVSEVVEKTLQRLVRRYGDKLGAEPLKQVYARAKWEARDLRDDRRKRIGLEGSLDDEKYLDGLDAAIRRAFFDGDGSLRDPRDYARMYEARLDLEALRETAPDEELRLIIDLHAENLTMREIGALLRRKPNTLWHRLDRWSRSLRSWEEIADY
jgi:DNA-directed RNA polymerase specialized sigma24 family protein